MFDRIQREAVRDRLLALAADDPSIVGAAVTGSGATGAEDEWSDIDLALAVDSGDLSEVLDDWTSIMIGEFDPVHHWDLPSGSWIYRVFLLPDLLEIDIGFAPSTHWGPQAESWRTVFGDPIDQRSRPTRFDQRTWTGRAWHHLRQARIAIQRGRGLQATYWIAAARDLVIESACRRSGLPTAYNKGAHRLPAELAAAVESTLTASTDVIELRRALSAATVLVRGELELTDPVAAERLRSVEL